MPTGNERVIVKSVSLDGKPYLFDSGKRAAKRAVWTVTWKGKTRRIVTTLERGLQERGLTLERE